MFLFEFWSFYHCTSGNCFTCADSMDNIDYFDLFSKCLHFTVRSYETILIFSNSISTLTFPCQLLLLGIFVEVILQHGSTAMKFDENVGIVY